MSQATRPAGTALECAGFEGHCITCADEGTPMRVLSVGDDGLARCSDDRGATSEVEVALVGAVAPGDQLLVHAATAIARLQESRA
jgi:hydrogenase maturation factor